LFLSKTVVIIKNYYCYSNSEDKVSHDWILKMVLKRMDVPPMILGEAYLVIDTGNEKLGKLKLYLVIA